MAAIDPTTRAPAVAPCARPARAGPVPGARHPCARHRPRRVLLLIGLLCCALPAVAQVPRVWVVVEPPRPTAGAPFRLEIHVRGLLRDALRVVEPVPPANLRFVSGPDLQPVVAADGSPPADEQPAATAGNAAAGTVGRQQPAVTQQWVVSYSLRARRAGRYLLDGFLIRLADGVIYTRETPIQVLAPQPADAAKPALAWVLPQRQAVVGQTLSLHLELLQWHELRLPERIEVQPPADSWFEQYPGETAIGEQVSAAGRAYRIPLASYLLTPTRAGRITVPPARVSLDTATGAVTLLSKTVTVAVADPPPEIAASGAVGALRARSRVDQRPYQGGLEVTVQVTVEGTGNHRFVKLPEPGAAGLTLVDRTVHDDLMLRDSGYTGPVVATYRYRVMHPGRYRVEVPEFVSYDPVGVALRRDPGLTEVVELAAAPVASGAAALPPLAPLAADGMGLRRCRLPWRGARSYLLLLPAPLIAGVVAAARRRQMVPLAAGALAAAAVTGIALAPAVRGAPEAALGTVMDAELAYYRQDYAAAGAAYRAVWEELGCNSHLSYNLALVALARGDDSAAIGWLREALRGAPLESRYRALLGEVERRAGLDTQHRAPPFMPPDLPFYALLLLAGATLAAAGHHPIGKRALRRLRQRPATRGLRREQPDGTHARSGNGRPAFPVVALLTAAGATGGLLAAAGVDQARDIVVVGDAELRRIPRHDAAPWVPLPAGTTLEVRGVHRDHLLVRTAYGLDAWVSRAAVLDVGPPPPMASPNARGR